MSVKPDYDWRCHACQSLNCAGNAICKARGFKAAASGQEIHAAISGKPLERWPSRHESQKHLRERMAALSGWKKFFAGLLCGMAAVGGLIFRLSLFSLAADGMLAGMAITGIAILLLAGLLATGGGDQR